MTSSATNTPATIPWDTLLGAPQQQLRSRIDGIFHGLSQSFGERLELCDVEIKQRDVEIKKRDTEIARLKFDLKLREEQLRRMRLDKYGPKSEKLSPSQHLLLDLEPGVQAAEIEREAALPESDKQLDGAAAEATAAAAGDRKGKSKNKAPRYIKAHPGRSPLPAHLERREVIIPCEEGAEGELIGYEEKEELVIKQAEFYVNVIKREKRKITSGPRSTLLTAPVPPRIIEKGQMSNSLIIELLVSKYCDHLPIYRQMKIWQRDHGIALDTALPLRAVMTAGRLLQPLARRIGEELKAGGFIQADETRVPVLQSHGKGKNDTAWFWQYSRPGGLVYFDYQDSRSRAGPGEFLKGYSGRIQTDGYEVYTKIGQELKLRSHAGCWAHVRRKFDTAGKVAPKEAPCADSARVLVRIAEIYGIEAQAREQKLSGEARLSFRIACGLADKLAAIKTEILSIRQSPQVLPASQLGKACDYALGQWAKLEVYASDGDIEIDNNWCENAMRPIALGRKNWMHLGSQESGPVVAAILSVIASAQRAGHNLRDYLADVFEHLCDPQFSITRLSELLPCNWKPATAPA
jgi:transposase